MRTWIEAGRELVVGSVDGESTVYAGPRWVEVAECNPTLDRPCRNAERVVSDVDVASLAAELKQNAEDYHNSEITHEQMHAYNALVWRVAERMGCTDRLAKAVSK